MPKEMPRFGRWADAATVRRVATILERLPAPGTMRFRVEMGPLLQGNGRLERYSSQDRQQLLVGPTRLKARRRSLSTAILMKVMIARMRGGWTEPAMESKMESLPELAPPGMMRRQMTEWFRTPVTKMEQYPEMFLTRPQMASRLPSL